VAIGSRTANATVAGSIRALEEHDVEKLHLGFWSRLSEDEAKEAIRRFPGRSVWLPESLEYAIVAPWRHRNEVVNVLGLSAAGHPAELLVNVVERSARLGSQAVISVEADEVRHPAFYERAGFRVLEEVITLDLDCRHIRIKPDGPLSFRLASISDQEDLATLMRLDQEAFPWLWRNSEEEFRAYAAAPGVELVLGYLEMQPVCYLGLTAYLGWGHLDRIAVHPRRQGQGLGGDALAFAIARLRQFGAQRIGLSTQRTNHRSQRLYERFGFRRVADHDYRIYGLTMQNPNF
jgi:ribosomal protein S18 acetylase RimI-like enzyme